MDSRAIETFCFFFRKQLMPLLFAEKNSIKIQSRETTIEIAMLFNGIQTKQIFHFLFPTNDPFDNYIRCL